MSRSENSSMDGDISQGIYDVLRSRQDVLRSEQEIQHNLQEIRILTLLPSNDKEASIECTLKTDSLGPHLSYTALSYTWGSADNPCEIYIAGRSLSITANLHEALKRFRQAQDPITLWVDAICINQKNSSERDKQVQLMRNIFSHAKETWLWLGKEARGSQKAVDLIKRLSAVYLRSCKPWDTDPESADKKLWGTLESRSNITELIALDDLLARNYWYRVWVVQEIAVSSEIVVFCGEEEFSWDSILYTVYFLDQQVEYREIIRHHRAEKKSNRGIQNGIQRIMSIQSVRNDFQGARLDGKTDSLLFLLFSHRSTEATDPKDKYIALAGLAVKEGPEPPILPFYHESVQLKDVYTLAAFHLVSHSMSTNQITTRPLDFLDCAGGHSTIKDLPSWAPDWSTATGRPTPLLYWQFAAKTDENFIPMNAVRNSPRSDQPTVHFRQTGDKSTYLQAEGFEFDVIKGVSFSTRAFTTIDQVQHRHEAMKYEIWPYPDEEIGDVLWKTCVLNRAHAGGRKAPSTFGSIFYQYATRAPDVSNPLSILNQWYNQNKHFSICEQTIEEIIEKQQASTTDLPCTEATVAQFKTAFINAVGYRKLATTAKGYLCLVPQDAEDGDTIALLLDCNVPVLLRSRGTEYTFVGTCYVHGIMNGEASGLESRFFLVQ